ncbi:flavodoxin [Streptococcus sp. NLN76]|uniref:flavodoxin family protein n=1 Tax=Streptococcus sp. NLN76 TaxID=2822800 RepID=UPI0018A8C6C3|nr:flavodoxin [Streptococcus sp. NLN76]MBF8970008.1 flavodoxin [Streptococcus sp. NLN76]
MFIAVSMALLTACGNQAADISASSETGTESIRRGYSDSSQFPTGSMDPRQIVAPQLGLSDEEWDNSRGTVSDGQDTNANQEPTRILTQDADSIIIYFSRSGSTELLASKIQALSGADVFELVATDPYPSDYGEAVERANSERGRENVPELVGNLPDLSQYKLIYLGYPIWGMTLAEPVASFVEAYAEQLDGKELVPFSTNGGYGLGRSVDSIETVLQDAGSQVRMRDAFAVEGNKVDKADRDLQSWFEIL